MRAFITGSRGFVGPWLIDHLRASGDEVVETDESVDVTDADQVAKAMAEARPDAVYHLAALSSVGTSWSAAGPTFTVNAVGTLNVVAAAQACQPRPRVLLVSSSEVYGAVPAARLPVNEAAPFRPLTPYAASKAAAELVGLQAHLAQGLEVIRARPFNHTGPGQLPQFVIPSLARQIALAGQSGTKVLETGNLRVRRDIGDVRDVVRAYRLLVERGSPSQAYNICTGRSVLIEDLARRLMSLSGVDLELHVAPERARPVDVAEMRGDPTRIHAVGWDPAFDLDQTLADVLHYWQQEAGRLDETVPGPG